MVTSNFKRLILSVFFLLLLPSCQDKIDDNKNQQILIKKLEAEVARIDNATTKLSTKAYKDASLYYDINSPYTEETKEYNRLGLIDLIKYYDKKELKKVTVHFDAQKLIGVSEYYYKKGKLFFARKKKTYRDPPVLQLSFQYFFNDAKLAKCSNKSKTPLKTCTADAKKILHDSLVYSQYNVNN